MKIMDSKELRILFLGTPEFAAHSLRALVGGGYNVVGVVTAPDKPAGRGLRMQQSAVKVYAESVGLRVFQPERLRDEEFLEELRKLNPDLGIVIAFRMLPEVVWSLPRLGTFNLHASLLPQYRGAAPINWAIINGEKVTGVTTFMLNSEIDKGDILGRMEVAISPEDNAGTLHDRLMDVGAELVLRTVENVAGGDAVPIVQSDIDEADLRPAPKIFKDDCQVDWTWNGQRIVDFIRGLSPYPGAYTEFNGTTLKIFDAHWTPQESSTPPRGGRGESILDFSCADGFIAVKKLQPAGKKIMTAKEFINGLKNNSQLSTLNSQLP